MSYDLMVFEPEAAPRKRAAFVEWFGEQVEFSEGQTYDDPAITSVRLREWFDEIRLAFPPLNGPSATEDLPEDEATATDYSITKDSIYACFAWSKVAAAYEKVFDLAAKHQVGFYNVSSDKGEVWFPEHGRLILAHQEKKPSLLDRIRRRISRQ